MAQNAITCLTINQLFWNFCNQKKRSAHQRHKTMAPSIIRLGLPHLQLLELCAVVQVISHHNQCSESSTLGYNLVVYPISTRQTKNFNFFLIFTLQNFSVSSVTSSTPVGVLYNIPLKIHIKLYNIHGLVVHHSHFRKNWHFPQAGSTRKVS